MEILKPVGSFIRQNRYALGFLLVVFFVLFQSESDTWWLLRAGENIWQGDFPTKETWSFTAFGNYWPNHEFAFEALLYALWKVSFNSFILPALLFSILTIIALILNYPSESLQKDLSVNTVKIDRFIWLVIALLGSTLIAFRPNAISIVFFAVLIFLLTRDKYFLTPFVFLLWANFHAGFIVGAVFYAGITCLALIRFVIIRNAENKKKATHIFMAGLIGFVFTFFNPLGYHLWLYLIESTNKPTVGVAEFLPIWQITDMFILLIGVLFLTIPFIVSKIKHFTSWEAQVLLFAFVLNLMLTIFVARFWFFFIIAATPFILAAYSNAKNEKLWSENKILRTLYASLMLFGFIYGVNIQWHSRIPPIDKSIIQAVNDCDGKVFNDYESGGYLLWANKQEKVFQDNRFDPYGEEIRNLLLLEKSDQWTAVFEKYNIRCALVKADGSEAELLKESGWQVIESTDSWIVLSNPKT